MFCTECGKECTATSNFCPACGKSLREPIRGNTEKVLKMSPRNSDIHNEARTLKDDTVLCLGMLKRGVIRSSNGVAIIRGIAIKSFWKGLPIKTDGLIYFDYNSVTKEAFNLRRAPTSSGISENHRIEVKGGNFKEGTYYIVADGAGLISNSEKLIGLYNAKMSTISVDRAQQKLKSFAIGAVGTIATLGIGAVLGAMHASKKYNTIEIETENGDFFIAQCRPQAYQTLYTAIKENTNVISNKEFLELHKNNKKHKKIESFFSAANAKEGSYSAISYVVLGLVILTVLSKCGGS